MYKQSEFVDNLKSYVGKNIFNNAIGALIDNNPFLRPIYDQHLIDILGSKTRSEQLFLQRTLFNIYEHDLMFIPNTFEQENDFKQFYASDICQCAEVIRPQIEQWVLEDVLLNDLKELNYNTTQMYEMFFEKIQQAKSAEVKLIKEITQSKNPIRALGYFLIQLAGDFLTEASGMARNLPGNYGPMQSELFKIFIDEYGYGVHGTKHSTAYERLLENQGLSSIPHTYWNYYLISSLAIHNYIHFICKNHRYFFRYVGALYYAEATYSDFCAKISKLIKDTCGNNAETFYFDEHYHIDQHHSRMVFDRLITPITKQYNGMYNSDIIKGFMEFQYYLQWNEKEIIQHIKYVDNIDSFINTSSPKILETEGILYNLDQTFFSVTDRETQYEIKNGELTFCVDIQGNKALSTGDTIIIPEGIQYGLVIHKPVKAIITTL